MIVELLLGAAALGLAFDNLRLRSARRKATPSGPPEIEGVPLPAPDDPRWKVGEMEFHRAGEKPKNETVLRMGLIVVAQDGWVFVQRDKGLASALPGSAVYGRSVWVAYDAGRALNSMIEAT